MAETFVTGCDGGVLICNDIVNRSFLPAVSTCNIYSGLGTSFYGILSVIDTGDAFIVSDHGDDYYNTTNIKKVSYDFAVTHWDLGTNRVDPSTGQRTAGAFLIQTDVNKFMVIANCLYGGLITFLYDFDGNLLSYNSYAGHGFTKFYNGILKDGFIYVGCAGYNIDGVSRDYYIMRLNLDGTINNYRRAESGDLYGHNGVVFPYVATNGTDLFLSYPEVSYENSGFITAFTENMEYAGLVASGDPSYNMNTNIGLFLGSRMTETSKYMLCSTAYINYYATTYYNYVFNKVYVYDKYTWELVKVLDPLGSFIPDPTNYYVAYWYGTRFGRSIATWKGWIFILCTDPGYPGENIPSVIFVYNENLDLIGPFSDFGGGTIDPVISIHILKDTMYMATTTGKVKVCALSESAIV